MPILSVKALPQKDSGKIESALKKTTVAISEVYGCKPSQLWATWQELDSRWYVEGEDSVQYQPNSSHPPICELLCFEGKSSIEIEKLLEVTAKTLSSELEIPNNIFITYKEARSGEVITGNGIVRKNGN